MRTLATRLRLTAARERYAILALLTVGAALRLGRFVLFNHVRALGEAYNVAAALADGRGFADAYRIGQGATAHVTPITPAIAGAIYRMFGTATATSETILGCWSVALALTTYMLLYRAFGRIGVSVSVRLGALAFLCIVPAYFWPEAVDFRVWDGGLSTCLTALFLDRLLMTRAIKVRSTWPLAVIGALLFFVNPIWGGAAYLCAAVYCLARVKVTQTLATAAIAAAALFAIVTPWAIRNMLVMDSPVLLRSNAGLELALAMHPAAVNASDPGAVFIARLRAIHPTMGDQPYRAMRAAGGEAHYAAMLGRTTWRWIGDHRMAATILAARHIRQAIFPDVWQFTALGGSESGGRLRAMLVRIVAAFGLTGMLLMLLSGRGAWIYPAILLIVPPLEMAFFQPVQRYTYMSYPFLVFSATGWAVAVLDRLRRSAQRRRQVNNDDIA